MAHTPLDLTPELVEALAQALARAIVKSIFQDRDTNTPEPTRVVERSDGSSPWNTAKQAAKKAQCSVRQIYSAVTRGQLKAARIGAGRNVRIHDRWIDDWLEHTALRATRPADPPLRKRVRNP